MKRFVLFLALLSAGAVCAGAAPERWIRRAELTHPRGNLTFFTRWDPDAGLDLRIGAPGDGDEQGLTVRLHRQRISVTSAPRDNRRDDIVRTFPEALPDTPLPAAECVVKLRPEAWAVYVESALVALLPPPRLALPLQVSHPAAALPPEDRVRARFQKVGDVQVNDTFMVAQDEPDKLIAWEPLSGTWALHTVVDTAAQEPAAKRRGSPEPAFSPNFYSLAGSGTNAVILSANSYAFHDALSLETAVEAAQGEMGLVAYAAGAGRYLAFTLCLPPGADDALLRLWWSAGTNTAARRCLAAARTPLTPGQWVKLRLKTGQDRLQGFLDDTRVLDTSWALPVGGRFGLFAHADKPVFFDDVRITSNHDLWLDREDALAWHTAASEGRFTVEPARRGGDLTVHAPAASRERWTAIGSREHDGRYFGATFSTDPPEGAVGLLAGYRDDADPHYRFVVSRRLDRDRVALYKVQRGMAAPVEEVMLPAAPPGPLRLAVETGRDGLLRCYRDGRLVMMHPDAGAARGAAGCYVGARVGASITDLFSLQQRPDLYASRLEKNRIFIEDPFMRNWASPEGEWIEMPDKTTWHKSDFFGPFRLNMPFVDGSAIHLGVREGRTNGVRVLRADKGRLRLLDPSLPATNTVLAEAAFPIPAKPDLAVDAYTVHVEDHWLWVTRKDAMLFRRLLVSPLAGRRIRLEGFTVEQLQHSHVERFQVKDYLFNESLYEWTRNGGRWEVINRFDCQPKWSHMNGESRHGFAALWSKYRFGGDFCMEFYAGLRHGWYNRCGDLNLTILADATTPSAGYTVTCTGWDPDHSQRYTRLYRNGVVVAESDKYLVPRIREGNKRRGHDPLLRQGRDVHGAWYYIKFRRIGHMLEYWFDNERVFAIEDYTPLREGLAGIWTYMNSMMVARVKVAAETIRPAPRPVQPCDAAGIPAAPPPDARPALPAAVLLKDGLPLPATVPQHWRADDPVGHCRLHAFRTPDRQPYLVVENRLGSGPMALEADFEPVPYPDIAGWRFLVKRTARCRFNFHYSVGKLDGKRRYRPTHHFFHQLSGTDFSLDAWKRAGGTTVAPTTTGGRDGPWHEGGAWTPVTVWLPVEPFRTRPADSNLLVRVEGFGNLQPGYDVQGLTGNGPGESYAVAGFTEVRYHAPRLAPAPSGGPSPDARYELTLPDGKTWRTRERETLDDQLRAVDRTGLVTCGLRIRGGDDDVTQELCWINLPPQPGLSCAWSPRRPLTPVFTLAADYPDRRLASAELLCAGTKLQGRITALNRLETVVPPAPAFMVQAMPTLTVAAGACFRPASVSLAWQDRPLPDAPVLMDIEGVTPFFLNFEHRRLQAPLLVNQALHHLTAHDPVQGACLTVRNPDYGQRLRTDFATDLSIAHYPLLQFRYRASPMTHVSLTLDQHHRIKLSEAVAATSLPDAPPLQLDGRWHTWVGRISEGLKHPALKKDAFRLSRTSLGSTNHKADQTGRFTSWDLDDMVFGPAVSRPGQLTFTPRFYDPDGIRKVACAVYAGPGTARECPPELLRAMAWTEGANGAPITPRLDQLPQGVCHLVVRAEDTTGAVSALTDIPFLHDSRPMRISHEFVPTKEPFWNDSVLRVRFSVDNGALPDLERMQLKWNDQPVRLRSHGSMLSANAQEHVLTLNWPYLFRRQLDAIHDGDKARIVISDIADGAGNAAGDVVIPVRADFKNDRTPPTLLAATYPSNILWSTRWEAAPAPEPPRKGGGINRFRSRTGGKLDLVRNPGEAPYLLTAAAGKTHTLFLPMKPNFWKPSMAPLLSMRLRRPQLPADKQADLRLDVVFNAKERVGISLAHAAGNPKHLAWKPPAWQAGRWQALTLDLREVVRAVSENDKLLETPVAMLELTCTHTAANDELHIQSVFVFAPWRPTDTVRMNAYDASGIDGISWEYEQVAARPAIGSLEVTPGDLRVSDLGPGWIVMRARDKAGNLSLPLRVPVYGRMPARKSPP